MHHDANVTQTEGLYALANAINRFTADFHAIAGSIRSTADADEAMARQWLQQIRQRRDHAESTMRQTRNNLRSYQPCCDEDGNDTTAHILAQLEADYEAACAAYADAESRYSEAHSRFAQIQQLIGRAIAVAANAANNIARHGHDAAQTVRRAADIIANEYTR
ncbi:MAG: hypothetical protein IJS59_04100 [Bacteroidaceae bacterium]|nr:hypothetical protein [Bacteroidaceae bacterium]